MGMPFADIFNLPQSYSSDAVCSFLKARYSAFASFLLLDSDILFRPGLIKALMACPERVI